MWSAVLTSREFLVSARSRSPLIRPVYPPGASTAVYRVCGVKRSSCWLASASSTTPGSSVVRRAAHKKCSKESLGHFSSTRPNGSCFSTLSVLPTVLDPPGLDPARIVFAQRSSASSTRRSVSPAYVRNGRLDILSANRLGAAVYSQVIEDPEAGPPNMARFIFLSPKATEFFGDWENVASDSVAILRAEAGRDPYEKQLSDLIGELSTRSEELRVRWAAHNVKFHRTGAKRLHHPLVGELVLAYEALELPGDPGQRILAYTAEPSSPTEDALDLLASWTSTQSITGNS